LVPLPTGAWGWLGASALVHVVYPYTMIRAYAMTALYTAADAHGVRAAPSVASYVVRDFVLIGSESV
jgi:hypothetical protein